MWRRARKSAAVCVLLFACMAGCLAGIALGASSRVSGGGSTGALAVVAGDGVSGAPTPGPATSSALGSPADVASDVAGNLYIADDTSLVIEKVTAAGALSVIAGDGQSGAPTPGPATSSALADPVAVAVDDQGDVYIADAMNDVVEKVTPAGTLSIIAGRVGQGARRHRDPRRAPTSRLSAWLSTAPATCTSPTITSSRRAPPRTSSR